MRLLITGGSGFVGLALARAALDDGWRVGLFADRPPPPALRHLAGGEALDLQVGDVRRPADVAAAISAFAPTHVVHGAALTPAPDREAEVGADLMAVNVAGTAAVVHAAAKAKAARVVVLSSNGVYGVEDPAEGPLDEARPSEALDLYGISKAVAERVAGRMAALSGIEVVVTRLGSLFGPFEYESGVRPVMSPQLQMMRAAYEGRPAILGWPMRYDWIYVRDATRGILTALTAPGIAGGTFNIGSGTRTDLLAWGALLARHFPNWTCSLAGEGAVPNIAYRMNHERPSLAVARFAAATGYRAAFDQAAAAEDFVAWFRDYARLAGG